MDLFDATTDQQVIDQVTQPVHHFAAGTYIKEMRLPKHTFAQQHVHNYDHHSILAQGRVMLLVDDEKREVVAPACLLIKAGKHHAVVALEDSVWFCIHGAELGPPDDVQIMRS